MKLYEAQTFAISRLHQERRSAPDFRYFFIISQKGTEEMSKGQQDILLLPQSSLSLYELTANPVYSW